MTDIDPTRPGLGTWENDIFDECVASVRTALEEGYRHVDTAQAYGNEDAVGEGIAAADVDREDVFLATKIDTSNLGYDDVHATARESLERLGTDYVDLLYVHWPIDTYEAGETLRAFQELADEGLVRRVGVSNFLPRRLEEAAAVLEDPVYAHQVELHPYLQQEGLRAYAVENDHYLVAYSPLARGRVLDDPVIEEVAAKHEASTAQVALAWALDLDRVVPIPKSSSEAHIRENWRAADLELDEEDHERIADLDCGEREIDFRGAPWNQ
jgi:diketogulonate reductase-like aldo/keto reductase